MGCVTDERLTSVRFEVESGSVSPQSLVALFNAASDADHDGDLATLRQTLELARAIAGAEGSYRSDAEQLVAICERMLGAAAGTGSTSSESIVCPECGNEVTASALRCRRCGHLFL